MSRKDSSEVVLDESRVLHVNGLPTPISNSGTSVPLSTGGSLHVQPFRRTGSKQLRAMVTYIPRKSHFDRENIASGDDPFRGFFSLFWIFMFMIALRTFVASFDEHGYPVSLSFATLLSKDALGLLLSEIVLTACSLLSLPLAKAFEKGWIKYYWTGVFLQHTYQTLMLAAAVTWTFNRQWPWVQSGYFTLRCLVLMMKIHSYLALNGYLSTVAALQKQTERALKRTCEDLGGYEKALHEAKMVRSAREEEEERHRDSNTSGTSTPAGTPNPILMGKGNPLEASSLRNRLLAVPQRSYSNSSLASENGGSPLHSGPNLSATSAGTEAPRIKASYQHPLVDHPNPAISSLAHNLSEMEMELTKKAVGDEENGVKEGKGTKWPENITMWNFFDYQCLPTLCYELEYPRNRSIRLGYVMEKTVATFGTFALLYMITEHYIIPLTPTPDQSFFRSLLDLALPFMLSYLLLFYLMFECICNGIAELSRFADRQFYEDWWNSTSFEEFSRKWNKPVHMFLLRHVYNASMSSRKISRGGAAFITFLLSACVHELVMAIVTQKIRAYLFVMQMAQLPLIALGRLPIVRRNKTIGNVVFWIGLLSGFPLLCVAYCAY